MRLVEVEFHAHLSAVAVVVNVRVTGGCVIVICLGILAVDGGSDRGKESDGLGSTPFLYGK